MDSFDVVVLLAEARALREETERWTAALADEIDRARAMRRTIHRQHPESGRTRLNQ